MELTLKFDTEKDNISLQDVNDFLSKAANTTQPKKVNIQPVANQPAIENLLTLPTPTKISHINKPITSIDFTVGEEQIINGTKFVIQTPVYSDKGTISRNPNGYRLKDYQGTIYLICNLARFQRQHRNKLPNYTSLNNMAAGRTNHYNGWTSVEKEYSHIQPYVGFDIESVA